MKDRKRMPEAIGELKCRNKREAYYGAFLLLLGVAIGYFSSNTLNANDTSTEGSVKCITIEPTIEPTLKKVENAEIKISTPAESIAIPAIIEKLQRSENVIDSTMRSCLGSQCFDQEVDLKNGKKISRIGLLALKKSGAEKLIEVINVVLNDKEISKVDLVYEHHVPAYGYGKNHGWSSIIRLARKVMVHSIALSHLSNIGVTKMSVETQIRQIVRWHCRLSHVAAHTRMLTVFVEDIIQRPVFEVERIISFMGLKFDRPKLYSIANTFRDSYIENIGNMTVEAIPVELLEVGVDTIDNEYKISSGLTRWPCKMFRDLNNPGLILPMLAADVAANCSAPYVTCSVQYDQAGG